MGSEISKALGEGAQKLGEGMGKTLPTVFHKLYGQVHEGVTGNVERSLKKDSEIGDNFKDLHPDANVKGPKGGAHEPDGGGHEGGGSSGNGALKNELDDPLKHDGGGTVEHEGAKASTTAGDPVDVASGQMLITEDDVRLPGVLPLVLRRVYASGRRAGRLLGPGWACTLDIRVLVDEDGIHFTDDEGRVLHYPVPRRGQEQVMPAEGSRWPLAWDRGFDTISVTDPDRGLTFAFTALGAEALRPLTALTDRNDNRIDFRFQEGLPVEVHHLGGYRISVETVYTATGFRVTGLALAEGSGPQSTARPLMSYDYDPRGRLIAATDAEGHAQLYEWDAQDRIVATTNRNGYRYEHEYDESGRVVRGHGPDGMLSTTLAYDEEHGITVVTDSLGRTTEYQFDEHGHAVRVLDPGGGVRGFEYDRYGRLLAQTDALGAALRFTLDGTGRPIRIQDSKGAEIQYAYNELGRPLQVTEPDGNSWNLEYDERGNLLSAADVAGARTLYSYGRRGSLETITDASGATTRFETDSAGLVLAIIGPDGATSRCVRDAFGRQTELTKPDGSVIRFGWDAMGRLLWQEDQDGAREEWAYDAMGNALEHRDVSGAVSTLAYGPFSTLISRTDHTGAAYGFEYDTELQLTAVTAPNGQSWQYRYDADGFVVGETDFGGRTAAYRRDVVGRLLERTDATGARVEFDYDACGRVGLQRADGAETRFAYDVLGLLTRAENPDGVLEITRDQFGRVVAEAWNGRTLATQFNEGGRRARRTTPGGAETTWTYDAHGRAAAMAGGEAALGFEYDPAGRETARWLGSGAALTQGFDAAGRLAAQSIWAYTVPDSAAPDGQPEYRALQQRTYTYGAVGAPREVTDLLRGNRGFDLGPAGRVTRVTTAAGATETYAYDALGNTLTSSVSGRDDARGVDGDREYDGHLLRRAGRTHYDYDAEGRLTRVQRSTLSGQRNVWTYTWDALGQLIETATPDGTRWRYQYDPLGRRRAKLRLDGHGEIVERTLFDWDETRLAEQTTTTPDGEVRTVTWDYEPASYRPAAQREQIRAATADQRSYDERFYAIVADLSGAPSELVAPDGRIAWHQTTSLWGAPIAAPESETDCPLRFAGQYFDAESGLHYNYHRYYDPEVGTYVSTDLLGIGPKANPRTYVDNPLTQSDPLGLYDPAQLTPQQRQQWAQDDLNYAAALHGQLNPLTQGKTTTAVLSAIDGAGNRVHIVSTSGTGITPPSHRTAVDQSNAALTAAGINDERYEWVENSFGGRGAPAALAALKEDLGGDPHHAEFNAYNWAGDHGYTRISGAANRNVCGECAPFLQAQGATLFGPTTAGAGPGQRMFHW